MSLIVELNPFQRKIEGSGDASDVEAGASPGSLSVSTVTASYADAYEAERLAELRAANLKAETDAALAKKAAHDAAVAKAKLEAAERVREKAGLSEPSRKGNPLIPAAVAAGLTFVAGDPIMWVAGAGAAAYALAKRAED